MRLIISLKKKELLQLIVSVRTLWFCHYFSALKRPHTTYKKKKVASYIYNFCNPLQGNHALYLRSNHKNQDGIKTELIIKTELKSKGDFDTAYDVAMCPLKKLIVFQPRDWPCQFYYGQIIYESPKKFTSSYPGWSDSPPQQEHILTGLSSYCYSMTYGITRNLSKNNLPQETSQTFILSVVPTIGPLNIS